MNGRGAIAVVAGAVLLTCAAVNLQVPLYDLYATNAGAGKGGLTLMFAAYAASMLPVLLGLGGLSDRVGRRACVVAALGGALVATSLVWAVPTFGTMIVARLLHGVAAGLVLGAGTAWLARLATRPGVAAGVGAAALAAGFGVSPAATGVAVWDGLVLRPWTYPAMAASLLLWVVPTLLTRDDGGDPAARLVTWPAFPRGAVVAGLAVALAWAVVGLMLSVVPAALFAEGGPALGRWAGVVLLVANLTGTGVMLAATGRVGERAGMIAGLAALPVVYALLVAGASGVGGVWLLMLGAAATGGIVNGLLYLASLGRVVRLGGDAPARAVAGYYLLAYLGMSVPTVGVGFLADALGTAPALWAFGGLVLPAAGALILAVAGRRAGAYRAGPTP